jgi:hypothetical protein
MPIPAGHPQLFSHLMELIALARQLLDSVCLQPKENTREARHGSACHRILTARSHRL